MEIPINTYPNEKAHEFLKSLMNQDKKLEMFFNIDSNGFQTLRIRAKMVEPFDYQITTEGFQWILNYLGFREFDDKQVDYNNPLHVEGEPMDSMQKGMFRMLVDDGIGTIVQGNTIKDNKGRYFLSLQFPLGTIHFFMKPDEDIIDYMKSKGLKV